MPSATVAETKRPRALWALDTAALQRRGAEILAAACGTVPAKMFETLQWDQRNVVADFYKHDEPLIAIGAEPWVLDDRQQAQQTQFLVPGVVTQSLDANLAAVEPALTFLKRFDIAGALRPEILAELARMNVTAASLFPGLDGFGRSMRSFLNSESF